MRGEGRKEGRERRAHPVERLQSLVVVSASETLYSLSKGSIPSVAAAVRRMDFDAFPDLLVEKEDFSPAMTNRDDDRIRVPGGIPKMTHPGEELVREGVDGGDVWDGDWERRGRKLWKRRGRVHR